LGKSRIIISDIFFPSLQSGKADSILRSTLNAKSEKIILPVFTPYKLKNKMSETVYRVDSLIENHPYFQSAVKHLGHINVFPDSDTIVRKCPAFIAFGQTYFPHIALKALSIYRNQQPVVVKKFSGFKKEKGIIPVEDDGCFLIRYLKPQAMTEIIYPMEDVLSGKVKPDVFRDKIVIIGHTIMGTKNADLVPTPFGMQYGALVQMQSLYTLFSETCIWKISRESTVVIMILAMFLFLGAFSSSFWRGTRFFIIAIIALFYTSFFLFKYHNVFFNPVPMALASGFSYICFLTMNFIEARKEISKGQELLSVLESTQREIAAVIKPHEMPGMNKRVYLPAIHDTFFFKTPQITLQTINSLLGISDGVIFSLDKSSGKINILVSKENSGIDTELVSLALKTMDSQRVKIYNGRLPGQFKKFSVSNLLILRILEEPFMNIYGLFINKQAGPVSSVRYFTRNDYQWIASFCLQTVVALFNTQLNDALKRSQLETIMRLAAAIEYRDRETGMHITRVSEYCALIADKLNLPRIEIELIKSAVPLHDLGKIAIPDSVLLKPSALTEEEKEIIRTHTIVGAKMLEGSDSLILQAAYLVALYHHEKYDGTGYPYGLKGNAIPLYGRIASLADVFDALSSSRVYKQAVTFDQAIKKVEELAGKDFDPQIVETFVKNKQIVFEIYSKYRETIS
ncbi:MAG: CHASE2 domain-containing protein, partial [Candidatus Omnitrophica bacterium]|nr:CHASE2 domain-containing protein [Candidatus Omnitrophota bacterium]